MSWSAGLMFFILFAVAYLVAPITIIWGWSRWWRSPNIGSATSILALCGFVLASASALLGLMTIGCAQLIHGFRYYDPVLLRIFRIGAMLSLSSIVSALGGVWRANSLRWHSLVAGLSTLSFWIVAAAGE